MLRAVLLHHRLPNDAETHFDWLIERREGISPDDRDLLAFRVTASADLFDEGPFSACRIADHRRHYLDFEGPVSAELGSVHRIASGRVLRLDVGESTMELAIDWGPQTRTYFGIRVDQSEQWRFTSAADR